MIAWVTSFNFSLYFLHPSHAALWLPKQFAHFQRCLGQFLLQFCLFDPHLGHHRLFLFLHELLRWPNLLHLKHLIISCSLFTYSLIYLILLSILIPNLFACCSSPSFFNLNKTKKKKKKKLLDLRFFSQVYVYFPDVNHNLQ